MNRQDALRLARIELARAGGEARARKLSPARILEIAKLGGQALKRKRKRKRKRK